MSDPVTDPDVVRYRPTPADWAWTFGGAAPVRRIRPGTVLEVFTEDAFGGAIRGVDDLPSRVLGPSLNPQTGPFHVEGAEPGDTVAVHFVSIEPARDWAVSTTVPFFGALTSTPLTATLQPALPELVWRYDIDRAARTVTFSPRRSPGGGAGVVLPLEPMHGTVGVAPAHGEARSALTPGDFGGNLDTPEMRAGTTVYLGVNVDGALLSLGDGHARQGEGEACGVAVEAAMNTVLVVELLKGVATPWPRLEDAFRISQVDMVHWVAQLTGLEPMDAYQLVAQAAYCPIANVCDTNYTVLTKIEKRYAATAYAGVHARLRAVAAAYSAG